MRIVCLSAETADLCARVGAWDDVVAVSAFAEQDGLPAKPIASGFSSGGAERILGFAPDLVLGYSDVQADLAAELIRAGATVLITNQRTLEETKAAMRLVGGAIGRAPETETVVRGFESELQSLAGEPGSGPRVYFEEWPDPVITGIAWVGELIELLGGTDIFADRRGRAARDRTTNDEEICARQPDVVVASWCGKAVNHAAVQQRLETTPAVSRGQIHEIPSADILQPGPRLVRGARALQAIFHESAQFARCV